MPKGHKKGVPITVGRMRPTTGRAGVPLTVKTTNTVAPERSWWTTVQRADWKGAVDAQADRFAGKS